MSEELDHKINYRNMLDSLGSFPVRDAAEEMGLRLRDTGQAEVPMLGRLYLLDQNGVSREDGTPVSTMQGLALAGYLMRRGAGRPAGIYVPLDHLTERVPGKISHAGIKLEARLARIADKDPQAFAKAVQRMGARPGGDVGCGGHSWLMEPLPKLPAQVVFYPSDDEFSATGRLLYDPVAINFLEFNHLATLTTVFVDTVEALVTSR